MINNKKIVIFGAGEWGKMAELYYRQYSDQICFVDNDKSMWGQNINGIPIYEPEYILRGLTENINVVVANKYHSDEICEELLHKYGVSKATIFDICENNLFLNEDSNEEFNGPIVRFRGGLGNQMFEYVIYSLYKCKGEVRADLSEYINPKARDFSLTRVFNNIHIDEIKINDSKYEVYKENAECYKGINNDLLEKKEGIIDGYHQSYKYADLIKDKLIRDFKFYAEDDSLRDLIGEIQNMNSVSLHVRRGDYLDGKYYRALGSICTRDYYEDGINYIRQHVDEPKFIVLSDDIEWVKDNISVSSAIYISGNMFEKYEDWYDMYIMSKCKHNIISNSTFGWWGAWLNRNENKIVIVPKKWNNSFDYSSIYPNEWIQL